MKLSHVLHATLCASILCSSAAETEKLASARSSFDNRLSKELDKYNTKARTLRANYLESLNRLKSQLGRDNNLKAAAQVMAEIEAVDGAEDEGELQDDADFRLKSLRAKWQKGVDDLITERNQSTATTVKRYFQHLDAEQKKLTRAAQIKDALLIDEEKARVKDLPEVQAAFAQVSPDAVADGNQKLPTTEAELKAFLVRTVWTIGEKGKGEYRFFDDGVFKVAESPHRYIVTGKNSVTILWGGTAKGGINCKFSDDFSQMVELSGARNIFYRIDDAKK